MKRSALTSVKPASITRHPRIIKDKKVGNSSNLHTKLVIYQSPINAENRCFELRVRNVTLADGKTSQNTLVKVEVEVLPDNQLMDRKYRGLNIDDLLIIKQNWNTILKGMVM